MDQAYTTVPRGPYRAIFRAYNTKCHSTQRSYLSPWWSLTGLCNSFPLCRTEPSRGTKIISPLLLLISACRVTIPGPCITIVEPSFPTDNVPVLSQQFKSTSKRLQKQWQQTWQQCQTMVITNTQTMSEDKNKTYRHRCVSLKWSVRSCWFVLKFTCLKFSDKMDDF